jgi:ligand-binding SRPBCC domain-containing protein
VLAAGPAAAWAHTHRFTPLSSNLTRIDEHIEFQHKPGLWGLVTRVLFSWPNLYFMFTYRKLATRWFLRRRG